MMMMMMMMMMKDLLYKVHVFVSLGPRHNQWLPFLDTLNSHPFPKTVQPQSLLK